METEGEKVQSVQRLDVRALVMRSKPLVLALVIYLVIALIVFYPITTRITSAIAGTGGDPYQMLWNIWWVGYSTFTLHQSIWSTALLFWPVGSNLIYQTIIPIGSILVYPFETVSLPFAYNVLFFLGMALSGVTMFVLSDYVVKNKYAAFIAGLIFTFSAFHIAQSYGHLEYANIEWLPLGIYLFLRIANKDYFKIKYGKYLTICMLSLVFILTLFMGDVEQGLIALIAFFLIFLYYAIDKAHRHKVLNRQFMFAVCIFAVVAFVLGSWAFITFISRLSSSGFGTLNQLNDLQHNALWSDDILSYLLPSFYNGIFHGASNSYASIYHQNVGETEAYAGYVAIALALYGIYKSRKNTYVWLFVGIIFFLLSLGPYIQIGGAVTGIPGPYFILKAIPLFNILREPGRMDLVVTLALAMLAAYGVKALSDSERHAHMKRNTKLAIFAGICMLVLLESATPPLSSAFASSVITIPSVPQLYQTLGKLQGNFSVLELPVLPNQTSAAPELYPGLDMYYTTASHKPIIGGYLTRENTSELLSVYNIPLAVESSNLQAGAGFGYSSPVQENYTDQTLTSMYFYNTSIVSLNEQAFNKTSLLEIESYLFDTFGAPVYKDNSTIAFATSNAIGASVYKNFVAYPQLLYWNAQAYKINNTEETLWTPTEGGPIVVYTPYTNSSYSVNTMVTINAVSLGAFSRLYVQEESSTGTSTMAEFNLTGKMDTYSFSTVLQSHGAGNPLFFSYDNSSYPVGIEGISFSHG